jgi:hypothetical protein
VHRRENKQSVNPRIATHFGFEGALSLVDQLVHE